MTNILTLFTEKFGMTDRSAKTMVTRIKKEIDFSFGAEVDKEQLKTILSKMKTGKYKDKANAMLFDMNKKTYEVDMSKRVSFAIENSEDKLNHTFRIFDSVFIDSNNNRGIIVEKVSGNYATVEITTGELTSQTVKIKVSELRHRKRGER